MQVSLALRAGAVGTAGGLRQGDTPPNYHFTPQLCGPGDSCLCGTYIICRTMQMKIQGSLRDIVRYFKMTTAELQAE